MCRILDVSSSGCCAWRTRPPSKRAQANAGLPERVREIHATCDGAYGVPRIHAGLVVAGERIGRKRIARLLREAGLEGVSRRKGKGLTLRDPAPDSAPDLIDREFTATGPDQLWVADIT